MSNVYLIKIIFCTQELDYSLVVPLSSLNLHLNEQKLLGHMLGQQYTCRIINIFLRLS